MTSYKSQGQTFEEALVNLSEDGIFVEDPFFKQHMQNIRKQRELGLEFDKDKAEKVVENLTFVDDVDRHEDAELFFKILKGRSPTGRFDYTFLPDMHFMPRLNKTYMPPKEGDVFLDSEMSVDWSRLEELCKADLPRPDMHNSGDDLALKLHKHPLIFKATDLLEDEDEMRRLQATLKRNQEVEATLGWPAPPMFIESVTDGSTLPHAVVEALMSKLTGLAKEYGLQIYFGTKPALKTAMYSLMYGATFVEPEVNIISLKKAEEMVDKERKIAITGVGGSINDLVRKIISAHHRVADFESSDLWNFEDFAKKVELDKPARDWEHKKLRKGKGHNKFKRQGKK